jgi:tRNA threonylcarbamoyladenosine biosynthesis protein TsaE
MSLAKKVFNTKREQETIELARHLGAKLKGGEVIELAGDIGSGKTTFVKGLAKGVSSSDHVTSPTFTIQQKYKGRLDLCHYDFYRLDDPGIMSHEMQEAMDDKNAVVVVEWAETVDGVLPKDRIRVDIKPTDSQSRRISIETPKTMDWIKL